MAGELKSGMTAEELRQWRMDNWTKFELANELMKEEQRRRELIDKHNNLKAEMTLLGKQIVRKCCEDDHKE